MLESFRQFWRKKEEVDEEIQKLMGLQDSESYKLWISKIRKLYVETQVTLLNTSLEQERKLIVLTTQMQTLYKILRFVPNEVLNLTSVLAEIERTEASEGQRAQEEYIKMSNSRRSPGAI